jgi:hypothetical protein
MPICLKHKLVFLHIPKTAGTSIEKALKIQSPECLYVHGRTETSPVCPQHMFFSEIVKECPFVQKYTAFTVVRNPFDRFVSEFLYYKEIVWAEEYYGLSFDEFVHVAVNLPTEKRRHVFDGHLEPQYLYLDYNLPIHLFKFENLSPLETWLSEKTSMPIKLGHELKNTTRQHYTEYYSTDTIEKISKLYEKDLRFFDYTF